MSSLFIHASLFCSHFQLFHRFYCNSMVTRFRSSFSLIAPSGVRFDVRHSLPRRVSVSTLPSLFVTYFHGSLTLMLFFPPLIFWCVLFDMLTRRSLPHHSLPLSVSLDQGSGRRHIFDEPLDEDLPRKWLKGEDVPDILLPLESKIPLLKVGWNT